MAHIIVTHISSAKINLMAKPAMGSQPSVGWKCIFLSQDNGEGRKKSKCLHNGASYHKGNGKGLQHSFRPSCHDEDVLF